MILLILISAGLGSASGFIFGKFFHIPRVEGVEHFSPPKTTILFDRNDKPYISYAMERRIILKPGEVPFAVRAAILAAEDASFYKHGGIHPKSIMRALIKDIRHGQFSQGGSTITQQVARMLFLRPQKTIKRKIEEALLAFDLEKRLTKDEILAMYCNLHYLGGGSYGIASAAKRYFNVEVNDLQIHQAALLAGLFQSPSRYDPLKNPDLAIKRRNWVIGRLHQLGYLTKAQMELIKQRPLGLQPESESFQTGQFFGEEVRRYLEKQYGIEALYRKGLEVHTTLDLELQRIAERALRKQLHHIDELQEYRGENVINILDDHPDLASYSHPSWKHLARLEPDRLYYGLVESISDGTASIRIARWNFSLESEGYAWTKKSIQALLKRGDVAEFYYDSDATIRLSQVPRPQGAVVIMDNATGQVLTLVGGYDFAITKFNRATQARRQAGSSIKPFFYAAALEQGWSWSDTIFDGPIYLISETELPDYCPENYYKKYFGIVTLRHALEQSLNVCAVKLFMMIKPLNGIRVARQCGIHSSIPPYASSALGAAEVIPLEITAAYTVFPNLGTYVKPYFIKSIVQDGLPLEQNSPETTQAIHPSIAYMVTSGLAGVINHGTGMAARSIPLPIAGKTGTTNDYTDAWFVGFSPSFTIGVWIGHEQKLPLGKRMPGGVAALPVWKEIMQYIADYALEPMREFAIPPGVTFATVDAETGYLATPLCNDVIREVFLPGTQPQERCDPKYHRPLDLPYYLQYAFYDPKPGEVMGNEYTEEVKELIAEGYFEEKEEAE